MLRHFSVLCTASHTYVKVLLCWKGGKWSLLEASFYTSKIQLGAWVMGWIHFIYPLAVYKSSANLKWLQQMMTDWHFWRTIYLTCPKHLSYLNEPDLSPHSKCVDVYAYGVSIYPWQAGRNIVCHCLVWTESALDQITYSHVTWSGGSTEPNLIKNPFYRAFN